MSLFLVTCYTGIPKQTYFLYSMIFLFVV